MRRRSSLRAARVCLLGALLTPALAPAGTMPAASAQGVPPGEVSLSLVSQTPWNTPRLDRLQVKIAAVNDSDAALESPTVRATLFGALPSRGAYVTSLTEDPPVEVLRTYPDLHVDTVEAGATREIRFDTPVRFLAKGAQEGRIYPLKLELLSEGSVVADLRTPVIFVAEPPEEPLDLGWTFVFAAPPLMEPDGTIVGRDIERRIATGGPLAGQADALLALVRTDEGGVDPAPVDVAVAPALLELLTEMQDGYRLRAGGGVETVGAGTGGAEDAAALLAKLRTLAQAPGVELSALPFASPSIPRMLASGLGKDLAAQLSLGRQVVTTTLGATPSADVMYPPGSAIDERSLSRLRAQGLRLMPLDPGVVEQPEQPKAFAPPATAELAAGGGGAVVTAIVPDPGTQSLFAAADEDPRLAAQLVLGDTAAIWLEEPARSRGLAMMFGQDQDPPPAFAAALTRTAGEAPWLRPTTVLELARRQAGAATSNASGSAASRARILTPTPGPFPEENLEALADARASIVTLRSMLSDPGQTTLPQELERDLLFSESNALVNAGIAMNWLDAVRRRTDEVFDGVRADASQIFTLTSGTGSIPVRLTNDTGLELDVVVRLASQRLGFLDENPRPVRLTDRAVVLEFKVQARSTGRFPVQVTVATPDGRPINGEQLVVRSTAYSRLALIITVTAVLILALLWVRRLMAIRRARSEEPAG